MIATTCLGWDDVSGRSHRCGRVIGRGPRCTACQRAQWRARRAQRDPAELAFYGSSAWKRLRLETLEAADWTCSYCGRPCNTAHHVVSYRERPDLALDPSNVRSACTSHQELAKVRT